MKSLFVGGRFDSYMGKFSEEDDKLYSALKVKGDYFNGGNAQVLDKLFENMKDYNNVFWFAQNLENKELSKQVKRRNNNALLVNGLRNNGKYSFADLMQYALDSRSNLIVELNNEKARVLDPLANMFLDYTSDMNLVGRVLNGRLEELRAYSRQASKEVSGEFEVPDEREFFDIVKNYAVKFQELIHQNPENTHRFYGNASFRCESGFPSFRKEGFVYVSKRNVDKRDIGKEGFVQVMAENPVRYFGKQKPSVDTPIQLKLYEYYKNVNYMIHGHVYVNERKFTSWFRDTARFTDKIVPCGALEEADEIIKLYPDREERSFAVNLNGHGSIVLAHDLEDFKEFEFTGRNMPEFHGDYLNGGENGR